MSNKYNNAGELYVTNNYIEWKLQILACVYKFAKLTDFLKFLSLNSLPVSWPNKNNNKKRNKNIKLHQYIIFIFKMVKLCLNS